MDTPSPRSSFLREKAPVSRCRLSAFTNSCRLASARLVFISWPLFGNSIGSKNLTRLLLDGLIAELSAANLLKRLTGYNLEYRL